MEEHLLILLITAHVMGDFVLQTNREADAKSRLRWPAFTRHIAIHAALTYLLLGAWTLWQIPLAIAVTHAVIDLSKAVSERRLLDGSVHRTPLKLLTLTLDQLLHLLVLIALARWAAALRPAQEAFFWLDRLDTLPGIAVAVSGLVITVHLGAVVIGILIEPYLLQLELAPERMHAPEPRGFIGGGRIIGQLERALVFLLVTTGNMSGVGFLVAAKSIFRFGELKDHQQRKEAEYILIGTLMSFTWSLFGGWLTLYVLKAISGDGPAAGPG